MTSITAPRCEPLETSREVHTLHVIKSRRDWRSFAMADDWDVEDLLEAPFKKGAEKVSFWRSGETSYAMHYTFTALFNGMPCAM